MTLECYCCEKSFEDEEKGAWIVARKYLTPNGSSTEKRWVCEGCNRLKENV